MNKLNIATAKYIENVLYDATILNGYGIKGRRYALATKTRMIDTDTRENAALDMVYSEQPQYGYTDGEFNWTMRVELPYTFETAYGNSPKDAYKAACRMARTYSNYGRTHLAPMVAMFVIKEYGSLDHFGQYLDDVEGLEAMVECFNSDMGYSE